MLFFYKNSPFFREKKEQKKAEARFIYLSLRVSFLMAIVECKFAKQ